MAPGPCDGRFGGHRTGILDPARPQRAQPALLRGGDRLRSIAKQLKSRYHIEVDVVEADLVCPKRAR